MTQPELNRDEQMEPAQNDSVNASAKLYSPSLVTVATVFGAPLAGCILMAQNCRALGRPTGALQCLLWGVVATGLLIAGAFLLSDSVPHMVLPVVSLVGMRQIAKQLQGDEYARHIAGGGARRSAWMAVGIGLLCLSFVMAIIFVFAVITAMATGVANGPA